MAWYINDQKPNPKLDEPPQIPVVCTTSEYLPSHNLLSSNNGIDKWKKKLFFLQIILLFVFWWQNIWINLPRHLQESIVRWLNSFRFSPCPVSLAENYDDFYERKRDHFLFPTSQYIWFIFLGSAIIAINLAETTLGRKLLK